MSENVKDRLIRYLDAKGISKAEFGRRIGVSGAYITSMRKSIQPDKLKLIAEEFPDLNRDWLLYGEGEMLRKEEAPCASAGLLEKLLQQAEEIGRLKQQIAELQRRLGE